MSERYTVHRDAVDPTWYHIVDTEDPDMEGCDEGDPRSPLATISEYSEAVALAAALSSGEITPEDLRERQR